jgi:hypothetical protein
MDETAIVMENNKSIAGSISLSRNTTALSNLNVSGNTILKNIDCGGNISINGSNAVYNTTSVDAVNYSNTYLTFRPSITNNDWWYVRQIGSDNTYKLAFDFHDDGNDARFFYKKCSINSSNRCYFRGIYS